MGDQFQASGQAPDKAAWVELPRPEMETGAAVEKALSGRRTVRDFGTTPLTLEEAAQLLWATQGATTKSGLRTAPSAGALYPLEVRLVAGTVSKLAPGAYHYHPIEHALSLVAEGDRRAEIARAALGQDWVATAPACIVISALVGRTSVKYGQRGHRYVLIEVGCAAENLSLQAVSLGLGAAVVGAFDDNAIKAILGITGPEEPCCLLPVGRPAKGLPGLAGG